MNYSKILKVVPIVHSIKLVEENVKVLKKKKKKSHDFAKLGLKNIVGTKIIEVESDMFDSI